MPDETPNATPSNGSHPTDKATRVRIRVDDRNLTTSYANAFRSNSTAEEVVVDLGLDLVTQPPNPNDPDRPAEIMFQINNRVIMNYFTAKRLAITLAQVVREHEQVNGEIDATHGSANTAQRQAG